MSSKTKTNKRSSSSKTLKGNNSLRKNITISKSKVNSKYIPKYSIINKGTAYSRLEVNLKKDEKIVAVKGAMIYMDSHVKLDITTKGIFKGIIRSAFTSESFFMSQYKGTNDGDNRIAFSNGLSVDDIVPVVIKPDENIMISPDCLLAYSHNLELNTKRRLRGVFTGEGIAQTYIKNKSDDDGIVWLSSYGGYFKLTIKEGESMKLDTGLFLCAPSHVKYDVSLASKGGLIRSYISKEGIVMKFDGPCEVYCQGKNINTLKKFIMENSRVNRYNKNQQNN